MISPAEEMLVCERLKNYGVQKYFEDLNKIIVGMSEDDPLEKRQHDIRLLKYVIYCYKRGLKIDLKT